MASLYVRANSAFHWLSYLDPATGRRIQRSTHLRRDSVAESRAARTLRDDYSAAEQRSQDLPEAWEHWVPRLLEQRYSGQQITATRYASAWRNLSAFLAERRIDVPRQLTRQAVRDYIHWRAQEHTATYRASKNTALLEIRLLGLVMREAVQSGFATLNPCDRLGIASDAAPRKARISDAEHAKILRELETRPEWMRVSYLIAWEQGCRSSETHIHLPTQVDLDNSIIRFRTKGHKNSLAEFPLAPKLVPLFARMIAEGKEWSYEPPESGAASHWFRFFRKIGLPHLTFHSTRVSFVTRCYEARIPREMVMRIVGHASNAAHDIYPRLSADSGRLRDVRALLD